MADGTATNNDKRPDSQTVIDFHTNDDVDSGRGAHHHRLGPGANQASPGPHSHDGNDSVQLLSQALTGSRSGGGALVSVISALVSLGAVDQTTA